MNIEKVLYEKIERWIYENDWENEENVASAMAITNAEFSESPDDCEISLEMLGSEWYFFKSTFTLNGHQHEDRMFYGNTLSVYVEGNLIFRGGEEQYPSIENENLWEIDDYSVDANVDDSYHEENINHLELIENKQKAQELFTKLISKEGDFLFRGQADFSWELKTTFARHKLTSTDAAKLRLEFERKTAFLYPNQFPLNIITRIFMMRHHGLPTKIMDWTTSPLIALYFAVSDKKYYDKDAYVFILNQKLLKNYTLQKQGLSFEEFLEKIESCQYDNNFPPVLSIHSPQTNQRMVMQHAQFTLHNSDESTPFPLPLEKVLIPHNIKPHLMQILKNCGINRGFIFPDIDNICLQIMEDIYGK